MNISINIGEILTKAWKITWKFKVLWIFGILAGCGAGNRGSFNNSMSNGSGSGRNPTNNLPNFDNGRLQEAIMSFINQYLGIIVVVVSFVCILTILFYFLGVMGKTGLIKGAQKADAGAEKLSFGELWTESLKYFWRMFGVSLLFSIPFFIAIVLIVVVFFAILLGASKGGSSELSGVVPLLSALAVFVPAICCVGLAAIVVSMVIEQVKIAIVVEDLGVVASLRHGWNVFRRNFLSIIVVSIILGVIDGIVSFVSALPLLIVAVPAGISFAMMAASRSADTTAAMAPLAIAAICAIAYIPVLLILRGVEQTYNQSAITLTYLRLTAPAPDHTVEPIDA